MKNRIEMQVQIDPAPMADPSSTELARQARRRFIKVGASTLPAGLTLVSRPARAWHCNSTSAWGSAQVNPNNSTNTRNADDKLPDNSWTIANWAQNTSGIMGQQPWAALGQALGKSLVTSKGAVNAAGQALQLQSVIKGTGGIYPAGTSGSTLLYTVLTKGPVFAQYMVVAYLNLTLIPNTNIKVCLSSGNTSALQDLTTMFSGTFQVPNLKGGAWGQAEIMNYLDSNWIVIPS